MMAPINTPKVLETYARGAPFITSFHKRNIDVILAKKAGKSQYGKYDTIPLSGSGLVTK